MKLGGLGAVLLMVVAACQSTARGEGRGRPLKGSEITALLSGGALIRSVPCVPGESFLQEETVAASGEYVARQDRADATGHASVQNDQLCVVVHENRQCRRLYQDAEGRLWQEQQFEPGAPIVSRQIEFLPINTQLVCGGRK